MTKQERIHKLMELLQASLDGKEIEQCDAGHWYSSKVEFANVQTVHQFRVKPDAITNKYRVALFHSSVDSFITDSLDSHNKDEESQWERCPAFICWLTPWVEYTVEQ